MGLQQDPYAQVGGVLRRRAESAGRRRVGLAGLLAGVGAREDADEGGAQIPGQAEELADLVQYGCVVARRRDARVPGQSQDLDAARLELRHHVGPFGRTEARVHRFLGVGAQFDAVVTVRGGEAYDVGDRESGYTERGEGELHGADLTG